MKLNKNGKPLFFRREAKEKIIRLYIWCLDYAHQELNVRAATEVSQRATGSNWLAYLSISNQPPEKQKRLKFYYMHTYL